jgi:predicted  nucleic acid-binding Zn-ribbon protein
MTIDAEALRTLHRLHIQLSELNQRLARGPKQINAGESRLAKLKDDHKVAREVYLRTRMTIDDKELSLKEREGKILDIRSRLNSCSNNKEYQAYVEQIAADEQANSVLSDEIIELLDKSTKNQEEVAEAEASVNTCDDELKNIVERVNGEKKTLESEVGSIAEELTGAERALPGDIREDYQRVVKKHREEALAPIDDDCCGGCYQRVTSQMLNELALSKAVFCKSCGRLLYLPEDTKVS